MKKPAAILTLILLSAAAAVPSFADSAAARKRPAPPVDEIALKGVKPTGTPTANPRDTVMYSGDTTGAATWQRALASCGGVSGAPGPMNYQVQPFHVGTNGAYDITSVQAGGWDGYLVIYQGTFDPNNQTTNCIGGDDDGAGGIGTSEVFGLALTAGTQYWVVTTGFDNAEFGAYTNTITGPGTVTLGALGGTVDLSITKTGSVPESGNFSYTLTAANAGPDPATAVVVTDALPASLTYVSDTCGGGVVTLTGGQTWQWNIGALAAAGSSTCTLTVAIATPGCQPVTNVASISSTNFDSNPSNNNATATNATEAVADGGFEGGSPSADWTEASTNFGTPLCTVAACGTGTGTGPHGGDWWSWFGGIAAPEVGSMTQTVTIPAGASLSFWFEAPVCANSTDFVRAQIDGTTVWEATGAHPQCNTVGYVQQTADISAFDDGASHTLTFTSTISGSPSGTNFFIDDISIAAPTCVPPIPNGPDFATSFDVAVPTLSEIGLAAMAILMAASAFVVLRKR